MRCSQMIVLSVFSKAPATTEIYTLSLHDALPILTSRWSTSCATPSAASDHVRGESRIRAEAPRAFEPEKHRSEEHTSELQSPDHLVCRLLLEKKKGLRTSASSTPAADASAPSTAC